MKIAILTQPLRVNYGGILQAYALQTYLTERGHDVTIINRAYSANLTFYKLLLRICAYLKTLIRICFFKKKGYVLISPLSPYFHTNWKGYEVLPFVDKKIHLSREFRTSDSLRRFFKKHKYDCFIVGSDQVWRPCYSPCITDFFLKFLPETSSVIKVAYAASFGTEEWEFSEIETFQCAHLAQKFDMVSVREASAVTLCKNKLGVDAIHLLDPTLLLDSDHYLSLLSRDKGLKSGKFFLCYILDRNDELEKIINTIKSDALYPMYITLDVEGPYNYQISVEEWIQGFCEADFIVTDSFHACVFAILFNKPFIVWDNKDRGSTRIDSLLNQFDLHKCRVSSYDDFMRRKYDLMFELDSAKIYKLLQNWRTKTEIFLSSVGL